MAGRGRGRGLRNATQSQINKNEDDSRSFDRWLASVLSVYRQLSEEESTAVLSRLIDASSSTVKETVLSANKFDLGTAVAVIEEKSPDVLVREAAASVALEAVDMQLQHLTLHTQSDVLIHTPHEISSNILHCLSDCDLCSCRRVSKLWKAFIDIHSGMWERRCDRLGIVPDDTSTRCDHSTEESSQYLIAETDLDTPDKWRRIYFDLSQQVKAFRYTWTKPRGGAVNYKLFPIRDFHLPVDNVVQSCGIALQHGFLIFGHASGEGKVYSVATKRERIIQPGTESADFRLYDNRTVMYYASNKSVQFEHFESLANPKESADAEVTKVLKLRRMATAVDCCVHLDLVVVGYESGLLELWSVSKTKRWCVYSDQHKFPIFTVIIGALSPQITKKSELFRLISHDPHRILVWEIAYEVKQPLYYLECNSENAEEEEMYAYGVVYKNGCLFHLMTEGKTCWLHVTDIFTGNIFHRVHLHDVGGGTMLRISAQTSKFRIFCLKDVGKRFALFVIKEQGFYYVMLVDLKSLECKKLDGIKRCCMEFQGRGRWRSTYCDVEKALAPLLAVGDSNWLDGFNHANLKGVLYAYANHGTLPLVCEYQHECNEIVLVKWNTSYGRQFTRDNRRTSGNVDNKQIN